MRYILTLLKDLPDYPKGTQFKYFHGYKRGIFDRSRIYLETYMGLIDTPYELLTKGYLIPKNIIDDPDWIKKDMDYTTSMDLKCPVCGETRGHIIVCGMRIGDKYDGFYNDADVYFEYDCGHKLRKLYDC